MVYSQSGSKLLEPVKELGRQELDHKVHQEFENKGEKLQHVLLSHGHKKSGWRVRLPTTGMTRL